MFQILKNYLSKFFLDYYLFFKGFIMSFFTKKQAMTEEIDFVVLWVDGNDPEWRATKEKYAGELTSFKEANGEERFRDWEQFHYWFRAVEKYAPWVRNVFLVTCGQVPEWLNVNHPKLRLVNHEDYLEKENLPTFNSSAIELFFHKIEGLGEYFVYFNDDMILTKPVKPEDFFQGGKPLISAAGYPLRNNPSNEIYLHKLFSLVGFSCKYNWEATIKKWPEKWFCHKYGKFLRYNRRMLKDAYMSGIYYVHFASPLRKSALKETEQDFKKEFEATSRNRFRKASDLSQFIFKIHDIAKGDYVPCSPFHYGRYYNLAISTNETVDIIKNKKQLMVCINDTPEITKENFEYIKNRVNEAFDYVFPNKSSFEN